MMEKHGATRNTDKITLNGIIILLSLPSSYMLVTGIHIISTIPFRFISRDLRYNHIKEVPSNAFRGTTQLHSIFLNENQIVTIHQNAFSALPALRYLYLNQNHIKDIAANAFTQLTKLERL